MLRLENKPRSELRHYKEIVMTTKTTDEDKLRQADGRKRICEGLHRGIEQLYPVFSRCR